MISDLAIFWYALRHSSLKFMPAIRSKTLLIGKVIRDKYD